MYHGHPYKMNHKYFTLNLISIIRSVFLRAPFFSRLTPLFFVVYVYTDFIGALLFLACHPWSILRHSTKHFNLYFIMLKRYEFVLLQVWFMFVRLLEK